MSLEMTKKTLSTAVLEAFQIARVRTMSVLPDFDYTRSNIILGTAKTMVWARTLCSLGIAVGIIFK
jgi:hypothetical protein